MGVLSSYEPGKRSIKKPHEEEKISISADDDGMALGGNEESGLSLPESQLSQEKPARLLNTKEDLPL